MNNTDRSVGVYLSIEKFKDEIQHIGNWRSGRYPRGSGKNPDSTRALRSEEKQAKDRAGVSRILNEHAQRQQINRQAMRQGTKQARTLLKIRKDNDKIIREGLKKLSDMTPEEAAEFADKIKRFNSVDMLTEEHMRSIAETKISQVKLYTAKMDFLDKGLGTLKTGMSVADKVLKNPNIKNLSEALGHTSKTVKAKTAAVKASPEGIDGYTKKYSKLTGASTERAKKEVMNIIAAAKHTEQLDKMLNKAIREENKKKKEEGD